MKPCQRRGFQFLFSEHQIGFFKSGALHIDHKNTCISCRKGNIADVGSMQEYDICICIACYSCLIHSGILRTFPDLLDMPGGALMRHIATLWVGRVEACHPSERGMEDHEGRVVQLPFGTLFLPSVGSTLRFSDKSFAPFQD